MDIDIRLLGPGDDNYLARVAPEVFDHSIDSDLLTQFLNDPRHHVAVAIDRETVVGFASAVHYIHPDKPVELWINEVGVAPTHQGQGIGKKLLLALFDRARALGCTEAWVLTDRSNVAAMRLYAAVGGDATDNVMFTFDL
ncbi:MAG TPA: GNAT family N-acetyltransferase [Gemmatimonadaceae bacterium]|nr:GNAT family N-acetyltransferase [Gemmatimonadaceae bacterium]